jgi:putative ABC transport system permease protein
MDREPRVDCTDHEPRVDDTGREQWRGGVSSLGGRLRSLADRARSVTVRVRAVAAFSAAQLRHYPGRTALAALGVALAVLLMTLMAGLSEGATTAGTDALQWIDRDLWMSTGNLELAPGAVGGIRNQLTDAHAVTAEVAARDDVASAGALSFQSVYASRTGDDPDAFRTVVGVGAIDTGNGSKLNVRTGPGFSGNDSHYAGGSYDGPRSEEVVIDERTAAALNVSVNDTIHVGGTVANAREFRVVGVSPTFSTFLGTETVTLQLSELQALTGGTESDPASIVTITVANDADPAEVESALESEYEYAVRTNREQLRAFVGSNAGLVVGVTALSVVAVLSGIVLVVNVLATLVSHQRRELAALRAIGVSTPTLVGAVLGQGFGIGLLGSAVGVGLAPIAASALNAVVADLTGFTELVRTPLWVLGGGAALALLMGTLGAAVAAWRVVRVDPLVHLADG